MIDNNVPPAPPLHARWISTDSRAVFARISAEQPPEAGALAARRVHYDAINARRLDEALDLYPVDVATCTIGGVVVHEVSPRDAGPGTLLCLHGGAFLWGSGAGAALEAVPVAAVTGMRVVAVDYRLAPEHRFPAAVDDVMTVLDAVRADRGDPIGIYGCSAGAFLTAQVVARLVTGGHRPPAAIAMLHGSGLDVGGDSLATAAALNGTPVAADIPSMHALPYFAGTDATDALVFPGEHPDVLAAFPPSLLVTGTRDFAASSTAVMHRRLAAAGVDAHLYLFDGMWHAHHVDVALPESAEVYAIMARFFRRALGVG